MISHIHITIKRALNMAYGPITEQNQLKEILDIPSITSVRMYLGEMIREGYEVIPAEGCDNASPTGRCLGHREVVKI